MQFLNNLFSSVNVFWDQLKCESLYLAKKDKTMKKLMWNGVLCHSTFEHALAYRLASKLANEEIDRNNINAIALEAFKQSSGIIQYALADIQAVHTRDPACCNILQVFFFYKGFLALQAYRIAHYFYSNHRRELAYYIQNRVSELFSVDIHPGAKLGKGIMLDHAHAIVIGETSVIGDNVSILHSVTLGGTGKIKGDRHPKVGNGVIIGAGAKILGNINIDDDACIAAGAVVLTNIPSSATAVGIPAKILAKEC
ncbi:serine O-acetyltransferase [Xenorhabdus taiwanensis]|uniref:Serine acetyltransferase n=1 Tax=Xenorhabdus taiwanensis TaxID=3085177 RepID=A0ABM8K149_9GAMM|nr:serine O-acetyltransferase [Xenorhabdus sp. TCT-1]